MLFRTKLLLRTEEQKKQWSILIEEKDYIYIDPDLLNVEREPQVVESFWYFDWQNWEEIQATPTFCSDETISNSRLDLRSYFILPWQPEAARIPGVASKSLP